MHTKSRFYVANPYRAEVKNRHGHFHLGQFPTEERARVARDLFKLWLARGYSASAIPKRDRMR